MEVSGTTAAAAEAEEEKEEAAPKPAPRAAPAVHPVLPVNVPISPANVEYVDDGLRGILSRLQVLDFPQSNVVTVGVTCYFNSQALNVWVSAPTLVLHVFA